MNGRTGSMLPFAVSRFLPCDRCARTPADPAWPCRCVETQLARLLVLAVALRRRWRTPVPVPQPAGLPRAA